jgi:hypothetical protein
VPYNFPVNYFAQEKILCRNCNEAIDWWIASLDTLKKKSILFSQGAAALLGAKQHLISEDIALFGHVEIDLQKYGVPEDSTILYVNYTPYTKDHSYLPLNWTGNEPFPKKIPRKFYIYGVPMPLHSARDIPAGEKVNEIGIMVTFIPHSTDDHALRNLAKAYRAYLDQDFEDMIIPAYVALEDTLKQSLDFFCDEFDITHGDQKWDTMFNHSLPLMLDRYNLPRLTSQITELGNKLYGLRNMLAHKGKLQDGLKLTKEVTAERLCAAIFIVRYLAMIKAPVK